MLSMTSLYLFFLFVFGLVFGSFVSMLSYRLPRGIAVSGRSFCDHCLRKIKWYENLPLASYFFLQSCPGCKKRIPLRYPIIEITTALVFVLTGASWQGALSADFYLFLAASVVLVSLAVIDFETQTLPDVLVYILGALLLLPLLLAENLIGNLLWGYLAFLFFLAIYLATRARGMGFGDVKLSFVLGAYLAFPQVVVWVFLSFLFGAVVGVLLIITGRARLGRPVPFGPFLIFAFYVAVFWAESVLAWYQGFLL